MKGFLRSVVFLVLFIIISEIGAKPVQNVEAGPITEISKNVVTLEKPNNFDRKRLSRQNVRIYRDPEDYEDTIDINKTPVIVAEPIPPKKNSGSGMFGLVSSILGSSSKIKDIRASEEYSRVRRQVEQIVDTIKKSMMNQTKSEKQEEGGEDSMEDSASKPTGDDEDSDSDEDEPPGGGDGMGGGILGILSGLSGEGGQSDLGTLLTTVGSIVANLSGGEGFDLNSLIGSAVALLAGILGGDGMQRIGMAIGGYLVTALEGITGGGAMNNGQFFGDLAATLVSGSSAAGGGSAEGGGSDSGTFFMSLLSSLFGGSSKSN